LREKKLEKGRA